MGSIGACCCCCLDFENLPTVCIDGYNGGDWSLDETGCCATKEFRIRTVPEATFIDGGDLDYNENTRYYRSEYWTQFVTLETPVGIFDGTSWTSPPRPCPECEEPFICGTYEITQKKERGTRFGIRYSPWKIIVKICCVEIACGTGTPVQKYVITSTYQYLVDVMVKLYEREIITANGESFACCSETTEPDSYTNSFPYYPNDPEFWDLGTTFGCLSDIAPGGYGGEDCDPGDFVCEFSRWKILDEIPTTDQVFRYSDCPPCEDADVPETCQTECCYEMNGVSNPGTLLCSSPLINSISCTHPRFSSCAARWYYIDEDDEVVCSLIFIPSGALTRSCGTLTYTARWVQGETPWSCGNLSLPSLGAFDQYSWLSWDGCVFEDPCPGQSRRIQARWGTITDLTQTNTCSGGTDREICIPAPTWTVKFPTSGTICIEGPIE
jgi:hypothetical protein